MRLLAIPLAACLALSAVAAPHRGAVTFNGLPVPGATVTAARDGHKSTTVTDSQGAYAFADLPGGNWTLTVEMFGFAPTAKEIAVVPGMPAALWELKLLPLESIRAAIGRPPALKPSTPRPATQPASQPADEDLALRAADGLLLNGSVNNGAASPFAQSAAFGNNRFGGRSLYNGSLGVILGNSAWDARPYSLTGRDTTRPAYSHATGVLTFGGPLRIPRLFENGPNVFLGYQWTRNNNAAAAPALVPTQAERAGLFSTPVRDPLTGLPFPGNTVPQSRMSPQALALLSLYPAPNVEGGTRYNYQVPLLSPTHQDSLQSRFNQFLGRRNQLYGRFAFESTRSASPNIFGFLDTTRSLAVNTGVNWWRQLGQSWFFNLGLEFSRSAARVTPWFQDRANVSAEAGIAGNLQDPMNWGPPTLNFSGGIASLSDAQSSFDRTRTTGLSYSMMWNRRAHNVAFGLDFRRRQFNLRSQQDPRGTLSFTGAQTGNDFADFLLGIPASASIAYGNPDKYFRASSYDAYINDDWRVRAGLTVNAGLRWEYGSPITELYGRLANLALTPGYTAAAPVVAGHPDYPASLVRPDRSGFEPRIGIAWRPLPASSLIVRAGYGIYRDTSVYQTLARRMAQQPPFSTTLSVQNTSANPFTLAGAFAAPASFNTFAIDPDFRVGYAQNWQLSVQRDLPGALQMVAAYLGVKGARAVQAMLPNTWPAGAANPCPSCPVGFTYLTSNGNSSRQAAQLQLRRRLRSGLAAGLQYTFSKSVDDAAALGGSGGSVATAPLSIAQNWRDLSAERSLSSFDQRHLLTLNLQYTTGMGLGGGTLLRGWTFAAALTAGSGLPQTPVYLAPVEGTAVTGTLRPDYTGAPLYDSPAGLHLNPAAYTAPPPGQWGNAGRNSITGPPQFNLNASISRAFRLGDRLNLDLRVDSANLLNHVTYTAWNTTAGSLPFGLPAAANAMRSVQTTLRLRF